MASYYDLHKKMPEDATLEQLVQRFFDYLDCKEESDSGREFHPVTIGSCRAMFQEPLNDLLKRMKEKAQP